MGPALAALRSRLDHTLGGVDERPQLLAHAGDGIADPQPAPPPEAVLEPVLEHAGDPHQVDVDAAGDVAV